MRYNLIVYDYNCIAQYNSTRCSIIDLPTPTTYNELQHAFDFFNTNLFGGELPPCLITLQRERNTSGYFSKGRFVNKHGQATDEIAMNPIYFAVEPIKTVLATMCHEMVHLWQAHDGQAGRGRYHNKEWAAKMNQIELIPSDTGQPGGRQTGDKMSDYIKPNGLFDQTCDKLLTTKFQFSWYDRFIPQIYTTIQDSAENLGEQSAILDINPEAPPFTPNELKNLNFETSDTRTSKSSRTKYRCVSCGDQAWGKPGLLLLCGKCDRAKFEPVEITATNN